MEIVLALAVAFVLVLLVTVRSVTRLRRNRPSRGRTPTATPPPKTPSTRTPPTRPARPASPPRPAARPTSPAPPARPGAPPARRPAPSPPLRPVEDAPVVEPVEAPPEPLLDEPEVLEEPGVPEEPEVREEPEVQEEPEVRRVGLRDRLGKARSLFAGRMSSLRSRSRIDEETWDELEEALLRADVGVSMTERLLDDLRRMVKESKTTDPNELVELLKGHLVEVLGEADRRLVVVPGEANVWLFVGVNGTGKTTSIGKVGRRETQAGRKVLMAAADTFRAAAAEQLELWSKRAGTTLVRAQEGADPGSVVFDAMAAAAGRRADLVLVDTAGRLHTKANLMEELKKLRRIVDRTPGALKEVLLVIDATTGQNGLIQAKEFTAAVDVTGVVLTKLDGTARGGIVLAVQWELGIPVKMVGVGEGPEDLVDFDPAEFIEALFA